MRIHSEGEIQSSFREPESKGRHSPVLKELQLERRHSPPLGSPVLRENTAPNQGALRKHSPSLKEPQSEEERSLASWSLIIRSETVLPQRAPLRGDTALPSGHLTLWPGTRGWDALARPAHASFCSDLGKNNLSYTCLPFPLYPGPCSDPSHLSALPTSQPLLAWDRTWPRKMGLGAQASFAAQVNPDTCCCFQVATLDWPLALLPCDMK